MFRQRILFVFIGICLAGGAGVTGCRSGGKQGAGGAAEGKTSSRPVYVESARRMTFASVLAPSGTVEAKRSALVAARIPGTIDSIFVDEGDRVTGGVTDLFQTDSLKLGKAVESSRKELAVAEYSVLERQANLERIEADFAKVKLDFERYKRLYEQDKAITANAFELKESQFMQTAAARKHAEIGVDLARKKLEQARVGLAIAEKDLRDSRVFAPISGVVIRRLVEPGEMAAAGTPVLRIEDLSVVEISAFLPEEAFTRVVPGKTRTYVHVGDIHLNNQPISYKSPTVSPDLRTFEVRCLISNPPAGVVPGRIARMEVLVDSREAMGVPRESIGVRTAGPVVFVHDGGTARMVRVETGLEAEGWIEIMNGSIPAGAQVVTAGKDALQDGDAISVIGKDR